LTSNEQRATSNEQRATVFPFVLSGNARVENQQSQRDIPAVGGTRADSGTPADIWRPRISTPINSAITITDLSHRWPDGDISLSRVSGSFGAGRTGLVGTNGSGKSTLLRLIAGVITPTSGRISTTGEVGYLPQTLTLGVGATIADLLGISAKLNALRAIESGDVDVQHFDALGDDWDIETRAEDALREIGFTAADLDRRVSQISGGEAMLIATTGLRVRRTAITLLDEPTNNLDRMARAQFSGLVRSWPGTLVIVSHDTVLLDQMENTAELHNGRLEVFGGPYSRWREHLDQEQHAATQAARSAEQTVKTEKRQRQEAEAKIAQRARAGKKAQENKKAAKIVLNTWKQNAQVNAGKLRTSLDSDIESAQAALDKATARVRDDESIHLTLPDPGVSRGKRIAELDGINRSFVIQGPERIALIGQNGSGKTTLLERLVTGCPIEQNQTSVPVVASGRLLTDRVGYLPQRLDGLDDSASTLDNVAAAAPALSSGEIRNQLARFLLRGDSVNRPVGSLSGGERFRVALARLLFADPPAQLLILDEPTNNLDLRSVDQLVDALRDYRGALLVVSHDDAFLSRLNLDAVLELSADGRISEGTLVVPVS
jgi:ATPase subunit of ABC transporter with duplicated ATPase domains